MTEKKIIERHFSDTSQVWRDRIYKAKETQCWWEYFDKQYRFDYFVYHTGEVVACCYDQEGENVARSLQNSSLKQIWNSKEHQDLRDRINNAEKNPTAEPNMCKNCLKWTSKTS